MVIEAAVKDKQEKERGGEGEREKLEVKERLNISCEGNLMLQTSK